MLNLKKLAITQTVAKQEALSVLNRRKAFLPTIKTWWVWPLRGCGQSLTRGQYPTSQHGNIRRRNEWAESTLWGRATPGPLHVRGPHHQGVWQSGGRALNNPWGWGASELRGGDRLWVWQDVGRPLGVWWVW